MSHPHDLDRREFVRLGALAGAGLAFGASAGHAEGPELPAPHAAASMIGVPFDRHEVVRIGIVGTGLRGRSVLHEWLGVEKTELAVMTELLLRGEQTLGELRGRAARMEPIADSTFAKPVTMIVWRSAWSWRT